MASRIQLRRDTLANWLAVNPVLTKGELGFITDSNELVVGNGTSAFSSLPRFASGTSANTLLIVEQNVYNDLKAQLEASLGTTMDAEVDAFMNTLANYELDLTSLGSIESVEPEGIIVVKNSDHVFISFDEPYHRMTLDPITKKFKVTQVQTNSEIRAGTTRPTNNTEGSLVAEVDRGTHMSNPLFCGFSWKYQEPATTLDAEGIRDFIVLDISAIPGSMSLFINYQNEPLNEVYWVLNPKFTNIAGFGWDYEFPETLLAQY